STSNEAEKWRRRGRLQSKRVERDFFTGMETSPSRRPSARWREPARPVDRPIPLTRVRGAVKRVLWQKREAEGAARFGPPKAKSPHRNAGLRQIVSSAGEKTGAGEGARTLDPDLGKVVLYH